MGGCIAAYGYLWLVPVYIMYPFMYFVIYICDIVHFPEPSSPPLFLQASLTCCPSTSTHPYAPSCEDSTKAHTSHHRELKSILPPVISNPQVLG